MSITRRNNGNQEFDPQVTSQLAPVAQALNTPIDQKVVITASTMLAILADALFDTLCVHAHHIPKIKVSTQPKAEGAEDTPQTVISESRELAAADILEVFEYALAMRVAHVSGKHQAQKPKDVEYPALIGPILHSVAIVDDGARNIRVTPALDAKKYPNGVVSKPENYDIVVRFLKAQGVATNYGVPMDKMAQDDILYRLAIVDGAIVGPGEEMPSGHTLLVRALLTFESLSAIFGNYRVSYMMVDQCRSAVENLAMRAVHPRSAL